MELEEIKRIKKTLGEDDSNKYYVYMLCDKTNNNRPFYIGKGTGDRCWTHENGAEAKSKEIKEKLGKYKEEINKDKSYTDEEKENAIVAKEKEITEEINAKYKKIADINKDNVTKVIVKWGLTSDEAFMAESALINMYNYMHSDMPLTNIVNGHMSKKEKDSISYTTKAWTVEDFLGECAIEEIAINDKENGIKVPIMMVPINNSYNKCREQAEYEKINSDDLIYECACGQWEVGNEKAKYLKDIKYVFAMKNSIVVGIYEPDSWIQTKDIDNSYDDCPKNSIEQKAVWELIKKIHGCATYDEAKARLDKNQIEKLESLINNDYDKWINRYSFKRKVNAEIPKEIEKYRNKMLKFVDTLTRKERGIRQNDKFNFEIKNKKIINKETYKA